MNERVLVLGAGFGGLELSTMLSEAAVEVTLVDCSDVFVFGYSKLDVMFGRTSREAVRLPYDEIAKPGCGCSGRPSLRSIHTHGACPRTPASTRRIIP